MSASPSMGALNAASRIWKKYGPHVIDSARVVAMAEIIDREMGTDSEDSARLNKASTYRVQLHNPENNFQVAQLNPGDLRKGLDALLRLDRA